MSPTPQEAVGTLFFILAVLHTFLVKRLQHLSFHLLGKVEFVFVFWAGIYGLLLFPLIGRGETVLFFRHLSFREPLFVFAMMTVCSTRPVLHLSRVLIHKISTTLPLKPSLAEYFSLLTLGPLLGSLITEPAAITVTALLLRDSFFQPRFSTRFKYITLALLLVNISIGGTLTPFAAPPLVMVARSWGWDLGWTFTHLGLKSATAVLINTVLAIFFLRRELTQSPPSHFSHKLKNACHFQEGIGVALFLCGLVILGAPQRWWLEPLLGSLKETSLFLGATFLTAFLDNAALTYLGTQVQGLADSLKYALVAGAVAGGGLTVIANAPNPAAFAILNEKFGKEGISPLGLFVAALPPTLIAMLCLWGFA